MKPIGPQHGIEAARQRWKVLDPGKAWPDKLANTLLELVAGHNELAGGAPAPQPEPQPEPPPPAVRFAPQTFNPQGGSDARYCVQGLPRNANGEPVEPSRPDIRYTLDGLCHGGRTKDRIIAGLRGAREMDGLSACDGYGPFPGGVDGWPKESYLL